MTSIQSDTLAIEATAKVLYNYLSDFDRFKELMPPQVTKWESTKETCSFNIQGMADIDLRLSEKQPYSFLKITSEGRTPFPLSMAWKFEERGNQTFTSLTLEAELNPIMVMMVKGPLQNFVNILVNKLNEVSKDLV